MLKWEPKIFVVVSKLLGGGRFIVFVLSLSGKFMDIVGRKKSLLVSLVISLIGWIVIAGASAVWIIIVGRFIAGWGASAISLICKLIMTS